MNSFFKSKSKSSPNRSRNFDFHCEALEDRMMLSTVQVIAAGVTNAEQMELQIDGQVAQTWDNVGGDAYAGEFQTYTYETSEDITASQVAIAFTNDLYDPENDIDRNLRIDAIVIDGVRYETEDPSVYSTGTWSPEDGIVPGNRQSEYLHTSGTLQFSGGSTGGEGSLLEVHANGDEGGEQFDLQIDGTTVASFTTTQTNQTFRFQADSIVTADQVRIVFTNDVYDQANNIDNNLNVDFIEIDGDVFQTEDPTVYSTGTWTAADGIQPGFRQNETLHTNGYLQFAADPTVDPEPGVISLTLDSLTINEDLGTLNFVVFRGEGSDGAVTVDYTTNIGTAGADDFQTVSGTLEFADGETGQQVSLTINDDDTNEPNESFTFTLSNPTGGATLGEITTQTITIADNDEATGSLLFSDSFESTSNWSINFFGNDNATGGLWQVGSPQLSADGELIVQPNEGNTGPRALVTGLAAGSSVSQFDVDSGVTSALSPVIDLPENAEVQLSFAYSFAYLNSSNDDYFRASAVVGGVQHELFSDHGHAEGPQESNWENVTVDLSEFAGSSVRIMFEAADEAGGNIVEAAVDDVVVQTLPNLPGTIDVTTTAVNLNEDAGTAEVTIGRNNGRAGDVTIDYVTAVGSATANDFTPVSGTISFTDGQATATVTIPITDDLLQEDLESFQLILSNPTSGAILGDNSTATITIVDNDNVVVDYLPDLTPIEATLRQQLSIDTTEIAGRRLMRFSTEVANAGNGPLEIWGGERSNNVQQVFQRVYQEDGGSRDRLAGEFVYHPGHGHIHFEGFASYDLNLLNEAGTTIASGGKTSFCLINIRHPFPEATAEAGLVHGRGGNSCGQVQGLSAGYSDVYHAALDDQWIDVTDVPNGTYWLEIETDPDNNILESDETNNTARIQVTINGNQVTAN